MAARKKDSSPELTFEQALHDLEAIVAAMENEQLPLEDLVSHYEKGSSLLRHCEEVLQSARGRIELITLRNQQEIALESAAALSQAGELDSAATAAMDDPDDDDDIRLF